MDSSSTLSQGYVMTHMHDSATMVSTYEFEELRPKMAVGATSHGSNINYSSSLKAPFIGGFFLVMF